MQRNDKDADGRASEPSGAFGAGAPQPEPAFRQTLWRVLKALRLFDPAAWQLQRLVRWVLAMALIVLAMGVGRHGVVRVHEHQVGVQVNKLRGTLTLKPRVGYHVFVPYFVRMYVFDKTIQRIELTWAQRAAAPRDVKLKAADGSQVSLDVTVEFKLLADRAVRVLQRSGPGQRFAELWLEPLIRHHALIAFGNLTMEELYDAAKRAEKADFLQRVMNEQLETEGVEVIAVIPGEFRFYAEYEKVIQEKKLADQQVEEQQAQARAAQEDQERRLVEKRNEIEAQRAAFEAEMDARLAQARAEAEKRRRETDGQYRRTRLQAEARLYAMQKQAEAALEKGQAEAEGLVLKREAMRGEGGRNRVALEYARQLQKTRITGTPITREPSVRQFAVESAEAAAAGGEQP